MERNEIIAAILRLLGLDATNSNWDLYERYSTSQLKAILNDMTTVRVETGASVKRSIVLSGVFIVVAIVLYKVL